MIPGERASDRSLDGLGRLAPTAAERERYVSVISSLEEEAVVLENPWGTWKLIDRYRAHQKAAKTRTVVAGAAAANARRVASGGVANVVPAIASPKLVDVRHSSQSVNS